MSAEDGIPISTADRPIGAERARDPGRSAALLDHSRDMSLADDATALVSRREE
jgi:hypothetical protein